jgi:predicted pyridoxine 5'-phosphate oxidase superfamily flavin-nucleotide-binding protein
MKGTHRAHGALFASMRTEVDDDLRAFLATIDTAYLATASADGDPYVQHRGGPKGFLRAVDENTLAFVDVVGNRQHISTDNLAHNDRVCLFLMDYAHRRRVKVWGRARMLPYDAAWQLRLPHVGAGRPEQVCVIHVTHWDVNCPQLIPQKVDAADAAAVIQELRARVAALEEEVRALDPRTRARHNVGR